MQEFRQAYRHADVLIIDDVHLFARRSSTQEELFHTFNSLHIARRQILLSGNVPPGQLPDIEARLISRFEWGISLQLQKPAKEEWREIIQMRAKNLNFSLSEEVVDFLLSIFSTNPPSLHRALEALILHSHLNPMQAHLDVKTAEKYLSDLIEEEKKGALSPTKIVRTVAEHFGIRAEDILGKSQSQDCTQPRQIAMYLCRTSLNMPYLKIGKHFCRDHSTVMTSVKQIQKKLEEQELELLSSIQEISKAFL